MVGYFTYEDTYIWVIFGYVCLQKWIAKRHVFQRDWTTCSKYGNHSRLRSEHNWCRYIYPCNEHKNLHFDNEDGIHMSSTNLWGKTFSNYHHKTTRTYMQLFSDCRSSWSKSIAANFGYSYFYFWHSFIIVFPFLNGRRMWIELRSPTWRWTVSSIARNTIA